MTNSLIISDPKTFKVMLENSQSQLLSLLKTVRAVPVDKSAEKKASRLILKILLDIELRIDQTEKLKPIAANNRSNQPSSAYLELVLSKMTDNEKTSLKQSFKKFPIFGLVNVFKKTFFSYLKEYDPLPQRLELLIEQIQLPLFRLAIAKPELILDSNHPGTLLLNELIEYAPFWKDESKIGYPTYTKLSQLLVFSDFDNSILSEHFSNLLQQIKKIKSNQQKRSLIFEKRLKETELSKAKIIIAHNVVKQIINQINQIEDLPQVVTNIIDQAWYKLLELEFLRNDDNAFSQALELVKTLIVSLKPIQNKTSLDQLFENLPKINQQLKRGFKKISLDEALAEQLVSEIELMHIALISQSEKTISESNDLQQPTTSNVNQDEILRLKPSDIYSNLQPQTEQIQTGERKDKLATYTPLEQLFYYFEPNIQSLTTKFTNEQPISDIEPSILKIVKNSQKFPWFWLLSGDKKTLHKLILSIENIGRHIFANTDGNRSLSLTTSEFEAQLKNKDIIPLQKVDFYQDSSKRCLDELEKYVSNISQIQLGKSIKNEHPLEADRPLKNKQQSTTRQTEVDITQNKSTKLAGRKTQSKDAIELRSMVKKVDIRFVTVGTWLKIMVNNQSKRCKLAARISSKDLYILVDRQGKKICELIGQVLEKKLIEGEIEIINTELTNGKSLESIISTNRSMKN